MVNCSRRTARLALLFAVLMLLGGCGQKGGLVRPEAVDADWRSEPTAAAAEQEAAAAAARVAVATANSR